eukprot:TRINITY_DN106491_c0_g1_i1.p1 TRINITY_DN106491_c0_g1~~TRINITY_DN106491_c0_g1_i1.p1  ORF type:complete len:161 (-),score=14.90 TRINITY_DN106491_c0_g1_i1:185-667(-)
MARPSQELLDLLYSISSERPKERPRSRQRTASRTGPRQPLAEEGGRDREVAKDEQDSGTSPLKLSEVSSAGPTIELNKAVVEAVKSPKSVLGFVYQASINVDSGKRGYEGLARTITIRGPGRPTEEMAQQDARELDDAAVDGDYKEVRARSLTLHQSKNG